MAPSCTGAHAARVLLAGCALLVGAAREAAACSVILPDRPESVRCGESAIDAGAPHTAAPAVALEVGSVEVRRSLYPPPGFGDCGELGSVALRFRLAGSASWPADIGVLINHVAGEFPWFQPPVASTSAGSGWLLGTTDGGVSFFGPDDPRQPLNVHLVARVLDCAGATSAPIDVVIADPGRPEGPADGTPEPASADAGLGELASSSPGACAMSLAPGQAGSRLALPVAVVGLAITRRARRRAP